jgi:hypothetical protein
MSCILSVWAGQQGLWPARNSRVPFDEDRSQVRTGSGPRIMASLRTLVITMLRLAGAASIAAALRYHARRPSRPLTHLPAHASWLDQAEIYFSVVQRKVLTPNDFTTLDQLRDRLAAFEVHYNQIARPFNWTFTRADLNDLLHRIDAHNRAQPHILAA